MTIPRLTGWWDEIGEDIEKLAHTTARIVDPKIDNKIALGEMLRQDPSKQQALVDLELNNPGMLEQLYGAKIAGNIKGTPSSTAKKEKAARDISDKKVTDMKDPTVAEAAALSDLRVEDALGREGRTAEVEGLHGRNEWYKFTFNKEQFMFNLEKPELLRQVEELETARAANPELKYVNLLELAKRHLEGNGGEGDAQTILALQKDNPAGYEMFNNYMDILYRNAESEEDRDFRLTMWNK